MMYGAPFALSYPSSPVAAEAPSASQDTRILGLPFFTGSPEEAVDATLRGGLVIAPAGPALARDLLRHHEYRASLAAADLILPDSGAMVLLWNLRNVFSDTEPLRRFSGLRFLKTLLTDDRVKGRRSFWVMPSADARDENLRWLRRAGFRKVRSKDTYVAPQYSREEGIRDPELLERLEESRPALVILNIGGGIQEPLGAWLKENLSYRPAIVCTGAAIALLSGTETVIPRWADATYLGWLLRIFGDPQRFLPRYLRATDLARLIFLHGRALPPASAKAA